MSANGRRSLRWDAFHGRPQSNIHRAHWPGDSIVNSTRKNFMLKTRITEQYGLKVPFINADMALIATAPLVRAVCKAGGMGMLGAAAMPPDVLQAAIRDIKAADPACFGVNFIARFSGIEHIEVCVMEKRRLWRSSGMILRTSGYRVCERPAVTSGFKSAAWTKRKPLSNA